MRRPSLRVVYVGRAPSAALAAPCSSCHAGIGEPCISNQHTGPTPHQCRIDFAEAIGPRDVADAPLVDWDDFRGIAPDATGDLSSEAFIRKGRDEWPDLFDEGPAADGMAAHD